MEDFNNYTFYKECLWDEINFNMYMNVFDEAACCCCCCIWTASMRHFKCVHVFRILLFKLHLICYEEFIAHFTHGVLRNYQSWWLWILCSWCFVCAIFLVQSNWEKKTEKSQWVLAQILPHLHTHKKKKNTNLHWLCVLRWSLCSFECFNWEYYLIAVRCFHQVAM